MSSLLSSAAPPSWRNRCLDYWLRLDLRSLGLFRILLGALLLWHLGCRWVWIDTLYTSAGVLPAKYIPHYGDWLANLQFLFAWYGNPLVQLEDWPWAVRAYFIVAAICYTMLLLGWRTRLSTALSLLFFAWLSHRNRHVMIGADYVMAAMLLWSLFLPLGARFSLDAFRARIRQGVRLPLGPSEDAGRPFLAAPELSSRNLAALAVVLQIGLIYLCTAWMKSGPSWWGDGTAVYYVLHIEQSIYPVSVWLRELPLIVLRMLTWATMVVEYIALPFILLPVGQPLLRRIAIVGLVALHLGIAVIMDAGLFSYAMFACFVLLLRGEDWELIRRLLQRFSRPATVYYDDSCGICTKTCEALALADRFGKLSFIGSSNTEAHRHNVPAELTEQTVVVYDDRTGERFIKSAAAAAALRGLPLPFRLWSWIGWSGVRWLTDRAYDVFARNRHHVSSWLGLTACGIAHRPAAVQTPADLPRDSEALNRDSERVPAWSTVLVALLMVSMVVDAGYFTFAYPATPVLRDPANDAMLVRILAVPMRLVGNSQYWNMFSPDASPYDLWWVFEVERADGSKLDPITGKPVSMRRPSVSERVFNSTMGEYFKHGLAAHGDYASPEAQAVGEALCRHLANQIETQWGKDQVRKIRIFRLRQQAPPLPGQADLMSTDSLLVASYDCQSGEFTPSENLAHFTVRRQDGTLAQEGYVDWRKGLKEGEWHTYLDDGRTLWSRGTYHQGVLHGPAVIWNPEEDRLREEGFFVDGHKDGYWKNYHPDGWLFSAGRYRKGERDGVWQRYSRSGSRLRQATFENGELHGPAMTWHENRSLGAPQPNLQLVMRSGIPPWGLTEPIASRGTYVRGQLHGEWIEWAPMGMARLRGDWIEWAPKGKPTLHGHYVDGERDGPWTHWIYGRKYQRRFDRGQEISSGAISPAN